MDTRKNNKIIPIVLVVILLGLIIGGMVFFYKEPLMEVTETRDMMDTYVTVTVYATEDEGKAAIEAAFDRMDEVIAIANRFNASSEVSQLNSEGYIDNPSPELLEMIELSIEYWEITEGKFDITILPLLDLWQYKFGTGAYKMFDINQSFEADLDSSIISAEIRTVFSDGGYTLEDSSSIEVRTEGEQWVIWSSWHDYTVINVSGNFGVYTQFWNLNIASQDIYINDAKQYVGSDKITVTQNKISLQQGMSITLDGMAKGYIVDEGLSTLKEKGIKHALINAGGDIATLGSKADDTRWVIGLTDPENPQNTDETVTTFEVSGKAVATSGNYMRWFNQSAQVGHIMDPDTGRSVLNCSSVTIIADSCAVADILATGVFVRGYVDGMALVETLPDVEALILGYEEPIEQYRSSGLDDYET